MNFRIFGIKKIYAKEPKLLIEYIDKNPDFNASPELYRLKMLNALTSSITDEISHFCYGIKNARSNAKPLIHFEISFCATEYPSAVKLNEIIKKILHELGIGTHLTFYALHRDTDNIHAHIVTSRINPNTNKIIQIENGFIKKAIRRVVDRIAAIDGWRKEEASRTAITMGEVQVDKKSKTLIKTPKNLNKILTYAFTKSTNWQEFHTNLLQLGPRISIQKNTKGEDELSCIFNGTKFFEKEIPTIFFYQKLKKNFGNYEELNHGFKFNAQSELYNAHFGERKNNDLSSQLYPRTNIRHRGSAAESILLKNALVNRIKNSIVRREPCGNTEQSLTIQKDRDFSTKVCKLINTHRSNYLLFRCGTNPDLIKIDNNDLNNLFLENHLRKVRLSLKNIDFYLGFDISRWFCFKVNKDALTKTLTLPFQLVITQHLEDFYIAIDIEPILIKFKNTSYLARNAIFDLIKDEICIDPNFQHEVGLLIYTRDQVEVATKVRKKSTFDAGFVDKINKKILDNISNGNRSDRADINTFMDKVSDKIKNHNVHFTRILFLFYYVGQKKFSGQLSKDLIADAFMDFAQHHGYTRAEVDEMMINFDLLYRNEPKNKNSTTLKSHKFKENKFKDNNLAEKCIASFIDCHLSEFEDFYWSNLLHEDYSLGKSNTNLNEITPSISRET